MSTFTMPDPRVDGGELEVEWGDGGIETITDDIGTVLTLDDFTFSDRRTITSAYENAYEKYFYDRAQNRVNG